MARPLTTRSDWLIENPPTAEHLNATLAGVAERSRRGEKFAYAVREFLDEFALRGSEGARREAIAERPEPTGDPRWDAYL
jgi:hypothetical protein